MYQLTLARSKKCRRDKQERAIAHKALLRKHKLERKLKALLNHTTQLILGNLVQGNNKQKKELENTKQKRIEMYGSQFNSKKLVVKHKKPRLCKHAAFRLWERFNCNGYTEEQIKDDLKRGWKYIKFVGGGRFRIVGNLGRYIINKNFIVITMYPHDKATTIRDASKKN